MQTGRASRTAEHNALFRALETARDPDRRLFADPLAEHFLSWPLRGVVQLGAVPGWRDRACRFIDTRWPGVRTSVVARTRLIDELTAESVDEHTRQAVVLGAGYDSRAYRLACLREVVVFEVDHPDTQRAKWRALSRTLPAVPELVRFVASDFNQRQLELAMARAGYREDQPTTFLWEGVTNYLNDEAVDTTLRWCSRAVAGSMLIFTYINIEVLTHPERYVGADKLFATLDHVGERLTFGIDPAHLREYLAERGLVLERDLGAAEYRERYFGDEARTMRGHEFYRVAVARVGPSA